VTSDDSTLSRLDLATGEVEALGVGATPLDVAAHGDSVWVAAGSPNARIQSAGAEITSVVRIDARTGSVRNTTDLPALGDVRGAGGPYLISAGPEGVWVINPDFTVSRLDPRNGAITASVDVHAQALAAGDGRVAVLTDQDTIAVIAPGQNEVVRVVDLPAELPLGIALGMDSIWVTDPRQGILWRIQPGDRNILRTIEVGAGASAVATGAGSIWVGNPVRGTVSRVDPETNAVAATIPVGPAPFALAVSDARVWAAVGEGAGPAATQSKDGRAVDTPGCGPLIAGPGPPPEKVVLTYSPLSSPRYDAAALSQASEFVLRKRGFRAGSFRVGVQHCDQATAQQESFTPEKCVSNARTFAEQPRVLAVIGPFNSGCAAEMIPLANRAGLAIVSPANTFTGLTRPTAGEAPGLLERLHPTGRRTYLRVVAPDDIQGAGIALEARELRVRRAFLVHDGDGYSAGVLHYVRLAAKRLGLRIAGSVRWQPEGHHARLARAFSKAGGDGLIVVGLHANHVGEVVAALRRHLGNGVPMIGPDSMLPVSTLFREAGSAAKSVHIAAPQLDPARLPQRGRAFLEEFARTQPEPPRMLYTIYGAVAAEVILDALARSDGSRGGLVRELFATRVRDGLAGPVRFDASGDVVPGHVTIYRPVRGGGSPKVPSADGAVVERVFTPDPKLVR
jgi:branched-chain amino acid transport system substrate-binding protein